MRFLTTSALLACVTFPVFADEVAIHADAIPNLIAQQEHYYKISSLSPDAIRGFAGEMSRQSGRDANCVGIASEQLPEEAEKYAAQLDSKLSPLVAILVNFSQETFTLPTLGFYRSEFLAGYGEGCIDEDISLSAEISQALTAIEAIMLLEGNIQWRRNEIIRLLSDE